MPIPVIIWAVGAAGAGYVAWKNRKVIMETVDKVGARLGEDAREQVDYLVGLSEAEGVNWLRNHMPQMNGVTRTFLTTSLGHASSDDARARTLYIEALRIETVMEVEASKKSSSDG